MINGNIAEIELWLIKKKSKKKITMNSFQYDETSFVLYVLHIVNCYIVNKDTKVRTKSEHAQAHTTFLYYYT